MNVNRDRADLPVSFLQKALDRVVAVGRIVVRGGQSEVSVVATGFLVSDGLLATCNHVIPDFDTALRSEIQFDYLQRPDGSFAEPKIFRLDPSTAFVSDTNLDFTIVAVDRRNASGEELKSRGFISMDPRLGNALVGEPVNIVQHSAGEPLQVSLRGNVIVKITEDYLRYVGQTRPGSAGSPVLNDFCELVGIHHATRSSWSGLVCEAIKMPSVLNRLLNLGAADVLREVLPAGQLRWLQSTAETEPQAEGPIVDSSLRTTSQLGSDGDVLALDLNERRSRDAVFLSYARADQEENNWKERLAVQLQAIARFRDFRVWDDGRIAAGADWKQEIRNALDSSRVAVLLIGPNFLTSDFIQEQELPVLLRDANAAGVRILPLITDFCPYRHSPLGRFQSVNDPKQPLESLSRSEQNKILADVAERVAAFFE